MQTATPEIYTLSLHDALPICLEDHLGVIVIITVDDQTGLLISTIRVQGEFRSGCEAAVRQILQNDIRSVTTCAVDVGETCWNYQVTVFDTQILALANDGVPSIVIEFITIKSIGSSIQAHHALLGNPNFHGFFINSTTLVSHCDARPVSSWRSINMGGILFRGVIPVAKVPFESDFITFWISCVSRKVNRQWRGPRLRIGRDFYFRAHVCSYTLTVEINKIHVVLAVGIYDV